MMRHLMVRSLRYLLAFGLITTAMPHVLRATPYASNVSITGGTTVKFTLNEAADSLSYTINGGAPVASSDGLAKGTHQFTIPTGATFSIVADKTAATGFLVPTGTQIADTANGLSQPTNASGLNTISTDTNSLNWFPNPRGVAVSQNPNAPNFGTAYISNGAAGTTVANAYGAGVRDTGDGLYALRADGSDAFGYGDAAQNPATTTDGFPAFSNGSSNSPYRTFVSKAGEVYTSDFADVNSNAFVLNQNLSSAATLFVGFVGNPPPVDAMGNPTTADGTGLPVGQNHGSTLAVYATGSLAAGNLVVYTLDEDINSAHVSGNNADPHDDRNSIWKYNIGSGPLSVSTMPTKVVTTAGGLGYFSPGGIVSDMEIGADGKIYYSQNRSAGSEPGIMVADASGNALFDSLSASRTLLGNPTAVDIMRQVRGIAVSPDQKWIAAVITDSDIAVIPLVNGLPDLANRLLVDTGVDITIGRDIAFDAAGNIHYVSSGEELYRVMSPGGHTTTTLSWNGTTYSFSNSSSSGGVAGDYNGNGVVDMADYVLWRNGGPLQNEGSTPGTVDASDYDFWRAHFGAPGSGSSLGGGSAVPEPGCLALAALGLLAFGGCRKRSA